MFNRLFLKLNFPAKKLTVLKLCHLCSWNVCFPLVLPLSMFWLRRDLENILFFKTESFVNSQLTGMFNNFILLLLTRSKVYDLNNFKYFCFKLEQVILWTTYRQKQEIKEFVLTKFKTIRLREVVVLCYVKNVNLHKFVTHFKKTKNSR